MGKQIRAGRRYQMFIEKNLVKIITFTGGCYCARETPKTEFDSKMVQPHSMLLQSEQSS